MCLHINCNFSSTGNCDISVKANAVFLHLIMTVVVLLSLFINIITTTTITFILTIAVFSFHQSECNYLYSLFFILSMQVQLNEVIELYYIVSEWYYHAFHYKLQ